MNEVKGYAHISPRAKTGVSAISIDEFRGNICRVMDWGNDGSVLVINAKATGLASFDKEDVLRKFECKVVGNVLVPPHLNLIDTSTYCFKVLGREGGYNDTLMNMVIAGSLAKGQLNDSFLFTN